jgi:hypothetical protein
MWGMEQSISVSVLSFFGESPSPLCFFPFTGLGSAFSFSSLFLPQYCHCHHSVIQTHQA